MKQMFLLLITSLVLLPACSSTTSTSPPPEIAELDTPTATLKPSATEIIMPPTWTPTQTLVAASTFTITPSPTITISPTIMATSTSKPGQVDIPQEISLASTLIQLNDLPPGFEEVESDEQEMKYVPLEDEGIAAMESVFYSNRQTRESVLSASFEFADTASQLVFDYSIDHIEEIMQEKYAEMGLSELGLEIEVEIIPDFPPIGDKSVAIEMEIGISQITTKTMLAMFRHDGYGGVVMILPSATETDSLDLYELTNLQSNRIVSILIE